MVQLDRESANERPPGSLEHGTAVAFDRVRRVIEHDLDGRLGTLFADVHDKPFALSSLGQVHRARTRDGDDVAIKVQHPGVAEAVAADLRNIRLVAPVVQRLAPALDAGAVLGEIGERIADELDYEIEAQHQRRIARRFRGHPHVRVPHVHTDLSARRVLVTEYVEGLGPADIERLDDAERDRIGEIAFRFFFGLVWRDGIVAGDPHRDNCILCPDGRLCVLDFGLTRDIDREYLRGERDVIRAVAENDPEPVRDALACLGYLPEPGTFDPSALLGYLAAAGDWLLAPGFRRVDRAFRARVIELAYPPQSPYFPLIRRLRLPPATLLLRRMELQVLSLLAEFGAGGDWGAVAAEHHSSKPPATALGREDDAFFDGR
jgi:hypothetical protein